MRILVTFAVEAEFAPWRKLREFRAIRVTPQRDSGPTEIWETSVGSVSVSVYLTGIGGRLPHDAMLFREAFYEKKTDFAISSGLAGSLKPDCVPGNVLAVVQTSTAGGRDVSSADPALLRRAEAGGAVIVQRLLTVDRIVGKKEEKAQLSLVADAVDMESALLMKDFAQAQVPAITIRAVSDGHAEDMPIDFGRCITNEGKVRPPQLFMELASHPTSIPSLIRFGQQSKKAAANLVSFLDAFISSLPDSVASQRIHEVMAQ